VPIVALTATADKVTRRDIVDKLGLSDPEVFVASFDRPNLSLTVLPGRNRISHILQFVRERRGQSGIVYCLSRKSTEKVAAALGDAGVRADFYHANLSSERRRRVQEDFINDRTEIICATIAFGMGIDKSNVRWVIHYNLPKNIEGYYQEIGRAGRDGMPSDTVLFYSYGDVMTLRKFVEGNQMQVDKLNRMMQYADALICRRKILLSYFSEELSENCGNCDVCSDPPEYFDGTVLAQKALSAVARVDQSEAVGMVIDVLRGSGKREVLHCEYHELSVYGVGKDVSYQDWQQYLLQLIQQGFLEIAYDEGSSLKLTEAAVGVLRGEREVLLVSLSVIERKIEERVRRSKVKPKREGVRDELFEVLRVLRKEIAGEEGVPPYVVFHDKTLAEMAARRPVSEFAMKDVGGVGDVKFERYGGRFIEAIKGFVGGGRPA
jgi:ATP-dependent DNA helicase RecQ